MTAEPAPQTLRIATFNVENLGDHPGRGATLEERIHLLRPQILRLRADILCLQEIDSQRRTKGAERRLKALNRLLSDTPYSEFDRATSITWSSSVAFRSASRHRSSTISSPRRHTPPWR